MHSVRLLHGYEILWACIWRYLTTSERLYIYRKTYAFLERWRMFLSGWLACRTTKTVTAHNLADNNKPKSVIKRLLCVVMLVNN